ncbi:unnamed protein product [Bursaphelenchus okinawaensis]|uniref:Uncharacterized protein n=1 Tax=Bursaphelenchus okinawaensis TaxID=465554 RepID=A0A811KQ87_9BILA|nr:unnamed protein product [Bursaphelenchus okinawaensis]CAG9107831.1 unnamed protein product [Bursaphelenchus okinawaensis]
MRLELALLLALFAVTSADFLEPNELDLMDDELQASRERRSLASGRWGLRPGKRSLASGRWGLRPGKRSISSNYDDNLSYDYDNKDFNPKFVAKKSVNSNRLVDLIVADEDSVPGRERRNLASGRWTLRPGKRSLANGRWGLRPGKRSTGFFESRPVDFQPNDYVLLIPQL